MLESDFILRMVEQLVAALARILRLKASGASEQALAELHALGESTFGVSLDLLVAMSDEDICRLLSAASSIDFERVALLARFFKERGAAEAESGRQSRFLVRALRLWVVVLEQGTLKVMALHREALSDLLTRLSREDLLEQVRLDLCRAYELTGDFARAENHLHDLLELDRQRYAKEATAFYRRLLTRTDQELGAGNLPRDEVEEALSFLTHA